MQPAASKSHATISNLHRLPPLCLTHTLSHPGCSLECVSTNVAQSKDAQHAALSAKLTRKQRHNVVLRTHTVDEVALKTFEWQSDVCFGSEIEKVCPKQEPPSITKSSPWGNITSPSLEVNSWLKCDKTDSLKEDFESCNHRPLLKWSNFCKWQN